MSCFHWATHLRILFRVHVIFWRAGYGWMYIERISMNQWYPRTWPVGVSPQDSNPLAFVEGLLCKSQSEYRVIPWLKEKTSSLAMHLHQKIYDDKQLSMVEQLSLSLSMSPDSGSLAPPPMVWSPKLTLSGKRDTGPYIHTYMHACIHPSIRMHPSGCIHPDASLRIHPDPSIHPSIHT